MRIQAIKLIRYDGVEHKPGDEFELPDMFGRDFCKRGMAKPAPVKKTKRKAK